MTRALIVGEPEKRALRAAFERARAKPIPWSVLSPVARGDFKPTLTLEDRGPEYKRPPSECVLIPHGFMLCVSFEEQPAGLCAHFSVSVDTVGKMPNPMAVVFLLRELGFELDKADRVWTEEFLVDGDPGGLAVNALFMVERKH